MATAPLQPCVDEDSFQRKILECSNAQAQAHALPARLTIDRLKQWVRAGLTWEQRRVYWAELPGWNNASLTDVQRLEQSVQKSLEKSERRWEVTCRQVDMNPEFLVDFQRKHLGDREPSWEDHCLNRDGITSAVRVLELMQHTAHTSHFPMLVDVIPVLLLVITEKQTYNAVAEMMAHHEVYLAVSRRQHKVHIEAFRLLLRRVFPQTARDMERIGADADSYLDAFFERFFVSLLPLECIARIIDEYLIEGLETVFRYGVGLFMMFKRQLKKAHHGSAESWWADFRDKLHDPHFDFRQLHTKAHSKVRFFTLNRASIEELILEATSLLAQREKHELPLLTPALLGELAEAEVSESEETKLDQLALESMVPSTVDHNEDDVPPSTTVPFAHVLLNHSRLIRTVKEASRLLGWCPESVRIKRPYLLFCSLEDGLSMQTMLAKIQGQSPLLVLVRTVSSGTVIGAYCPSSIKPGGGVVGDGSSFVFRLSHPHSVYHWVLSARGAEAEMQRRSRANTLDSDFEFTPAFRSESATSLINAPRGYHSSSMTALHHRDFVDVRRLATSTALHKDSAAGLNASGFEDTIDIARSDTSTTLHQFALGTKTYLAFGGSLVEGMNAIRLTHDLSYGSSGPSDTFGNPSLVPEEDSTFEVDAVEVIGFRAA